MRERSTAGADVELRVRFAADAASVPSARRFVADGLTAWGRESLIDDATLCVSELAGNAALHSASTFMEVALRSVGERVRISVEDDGATPAEAVIPRAAFPEPDDEKVSVAEEPTTGRGLAIVSILASDWGVDRLDQGKRIWADLSDLDEEHGVRPPTTAEPPAPVPQPSPASLPQGWSLVRLPGCPVELSLRQDQHLDELIRELQLIQSPEASPRSQALAAELEGLLAGPAQARHVGRRTAQEAAAEGRTFIDIEMAIPDEFARDVPKLHAAVAAADQLCEEQRLLTLASPPALRAFRRWMTEMVERQVDGGEEPVTYTDWLLDRG